MSFEREGELTKVLSSLTYPISISSFLIMGDDSLGSLEEKPDAMTMWEALQSAHSHITQLIVRIPLAGRIVRYLGLVAGLFSSLPFRPPKTRPVHAILNVVGLVEEAKRTLNVLVSLIHHPKPYVYLFLSSSYSCLLRKRIFPRYSR